MRPVAGECPAVDRFPSRCFQRRYSIGTGCAWRSSFALVCPSWSCYRHRDCAIGTSQLGRAWKRLCPRRCACCRAPCSRESTACNASASEPAGGTRAGTAGRPWRWGTCATWFGRGFISRYRGDPSIQNLEMYQIRTRSKINILYRSSKLP